MSDSVRHHRWQPTRLCRPWDSPGKNTGVGCHFLLQCMKVKSKSEVAQSYLTIHDPMDWSLPGSSIHGIFQARVLEWGAIAFSTKINYFHSNPCLRVCYWGTQTKTPTRTTLLITEKCIHSLAPIEVLTNNTVNPGLSNTVDFKCIWSKLRCAVCIQYTMDLKDSVKIFFSH